MAKFLFVYRGSPEAQANMTPEEMQQHMQKWGTWIGQAMQQGWMIDPGDALTPEGRVVTPQGRHGRAVHGVQGSPRRLLGRPGRDRRRRRASSPRAAPACSLGGTVEVRRLAGYTVQP